MGGEDEVREKARLPISRYHVQGVASLTNVVMTFISQSPKAFFQHSTVQIIQLAPPTYDDVEVLNYAGYGMDLPL